MLRRALLSSVALTLLALPPTAARAASGAPTAPRATGRIGLQVAGSWSVNGRRLAVTGRELQIEGRIVPSVAGESVEVRVWRGHKLLKSVTVTPQPTRTGRTATFTVRFRPERAGDVQIFALHRRSDRQRRLLAKAPLSIVTPKAGPGTRSPFVALLQQRLAAIGYATPQNGAYDAATGRAVLAFRKVNGMPRITTLTPFVVDRVLRGAGGFKVRYPQHGRHVEANLGWQVLALIDKGRVVRAYTTSSGKPSTPTVLGTFRFYMREPGTNSHGMVYSTYFIRGYAIHGYVDVPAFNASHGCLRVPIPDAYAIYSWIHIGDQIDVYY